jgi:hypothetical protein
MEKVDDLPFLQDSDITGESSSSQEDYDDEEGLSFSRDDDNLVTWEVSDSESTSKKKERRVNNAHWDQIWSEMFGQLVDYIKERPEWQGRVDTKTCENRVSICVPIWSLYFFDEDPANEQPPYHIRLQHGEI